MEELVKFVMCKHGDQVRRQREPYVNHVLRVAGMCKSVSAKKVALCHDLLEDTDCSVEELSVYLTPEEIKAVELLTKRTSNEEYLEALLNSNNALALEVKAADAADNADFSLEEDKVFTLEVLGKDWKVDQKRYLDTREMCLRALEGL